jgi:hypothetical protein
MQPLLQRAFLCTAGRVCVCTCAAQQAQCAQHNAVRAADLGARDSGSNRGVRQGGGGCANKGLGRLLWQVIPAAVNGLGGLCTRVCDASASYGCHASFQAGGGGVHVTGQHCQHQRRCTSLSSGCSWLVHEIAPPTYVLFQQGHSWKCTVMATHTEV